MKVKRHFEDTVRMFVAFLLVFMSGQAWAQGAYGYTVPPNWEQARITDIGVVVSDMEIYERKDLLTQKIDTVLFISNPEVLWQSESVNVYDSLSVDRAMQPRRNARKKALNDSGTYQWGNLMGDDSKLVDFYYYVFRFEYPSVDASGNVIMLSGIAACPTPKGASKVNNIIMGTHITITSDWERPSAHVNNFDRDDWGMLMSLAAGPKFMLKDEYGAILLGAQAGLTIGGVALCLTGWGALVGVPMLVASFMTDMYAIDQIDKAWGHHNYNNNLVILADYEGYGLTKDHAHPYLYQELTARQCVDATRYGRYLYEHDDMLSYLRHPIRSDFRCMSMGYSQGGSVALACHRFVEQNDLVKELHFVGSACGDGPYDPMATLMYYVKQDLDNKSMSMAVVLPLIVKGMLDTNPYMKSHKAEEYFRPEFLETGIFDWIASKQYSTGNIENNWNEYAQQHPGSLNYNQARLHQIMNDECYAYFLKVYNDNKDTFTDAAGIPLPQHRGVMEDLHLALSSNDMTSGWSPTHTIRLFHSTGDTVVPYVNAQRAQNALGSAVILEDAPNKLDHVDSGLDFFRGDSDIADVVLERILNTRMNDYVDALCNAKW